MTFPFQFLYDLFTRCKSVFTNIDLCCFIQCAIFIKYVNHFQVMLLAKLVVIHIMCRCDFQCTGTKLYTYIFISNDWNATIDQRNKCKFSMEMFVTLIIWMYANRGITHDCFGTDSCDCDKAASFELRAASRFSIVRLVCEFQPVSGLINKIF